MSLRHSSGIPSSAIVPSDSNGVEYNDDDSSEKKIPQNTISWIFHNSIWLIRTVHGKVWFSLGYVCVTGARTFRKSAALVLNGIGFIYSAGVELLLTSRSEYISQWLPLVEELNLFLETTGIGDELERAVTNYRFPCNVALLARFQDTILVHRGAKGESPHLDRRHMASRNGVIKTDNLPEAQRMSILEDGKRFVKFATAAYGPSTIDAADIHLHGSVQTSMIRPSTKAVEAGTMLLDTLKTSFTATQNGQKQFNSLPSFYDEDWLLGRISEHINIPADDIYLMNLSDDTVESLRFFVAVDHSRKAVVLSIRGSFTVKEILIDIAAFSRPFCGGEAHSEMAHGAERIWDEAEATILKLLHDNSGYELVVTGHSLGGGAACLLNILLHENNREKVEGRQVRCFAYAAPPVFAGELSDAARNACISYIHDTDVVPFLSVDSVRRIFAAIQAVDESNLSVWIRMLILWGQTEVIKPEALLKVENALHNKLPETEGAPELLIPSYTNVWIRSLKFDLPTDLSKIEDLTELHPLSQFDFVLADSTKLAKIGISFDPTMLTDHFPNGYESALYNLRDQE